MEPVSEIKLKIDFMVSALNGDLSKLKKCLQMGIDVNIKDKSFKNALSYACMGNHTDIARCLIFNGIDINNKDQSNSTPLHYACKNHNMEIIEDLLGFNEINLDIQDICQSKPFDYLTGEERVMFENFVKPDKKSLISKAEQYRDDKKSA